MRVSGVRTGASGTARRPLGPTWTGVFHRKLVPLAEAQEARPGADSKELARMARQIAA